MYDYIIIGSGFGGSVSALRLAEKGYKVLVIEQGKWFSKNDFPKTNWNLKKWLWMPMLGFFGIQKLTFLRHSTILSGTGVGGGSLVYANTLPKPKTAFYSNGSWASLANWEKELAPYYELVWKMLGAQNTPKQGDSDKIFEELALEYGDQAKYEATKVAVFFGEPEKTVEDPYFEGEGPEKTGCHFCGACMTGCRHGAKNTLDTNYLHLAQKLGAEIIAEHKVLDVFPNNESDKFDYQVKYRKSTKRFSKTKSIQAKNVIFAGGVLGSIPLLLKLKNNSLPLLSDKLGDLIRTNNEALIGNVSFDKTLDMTTGVAIGSIVELDENTHVEPVRYGRGSGFWRILMLPMVTQKHFFIRMMHLIASPITQFRNYLRIWGIKDFAKQTSVILFMQHLDSTLKLKRSWFGIKSVRSKGQAPTAFIPLAHKFARKYAKKIAGTNRVLLTETITGIPTTAHILGGAAMGATKEEGVIDSNNQIFDYPGLYVCDGSMISANPGVNPSLTIAAITERAMSNIPFKQEQKEK